MRRGCESRSNDGTREGANLEERIAWRGRRGLWLIVGVSERPLYNDALDMDFAAWKVFLQDFQGFFSV